MGYLRRKIVLIMILCMALSVSLVGALSVRTSRRIVNENAVQRLELLCQENQLRLDAVTDSIEQSVDVLASGVLGALDDPASFRSDADYVRRYSESLRSLLLTAAENTNGSMALTDAGSLRSGDTPEIDVRGRRIAAEVVPLPFYKR